MSESFTSDDRDDALDAFLRAHGPLPLADDGFAESTMREIARVDPAPAPSAARTAARRVAPLSPLDAARALAAEQRRYAAQARLWRWAVAGVVAGIALLVLAMLAAPGGGTLEASSAALNMTGVPSWFPIWSVLVAGAIWYAWQEVRAD